MFKVLSLFLLSSLMAIPAAANDAPAESFKSVQIQEIRRDGEDSDALNRYTYTVSEKGNNRTYDSTDLGPTIKTNFCAPMGYVYSLTYEEEKLDEIVTIFDSIGTSFDWVDIIINYVIYGTEVYEESNPFWYTDDKPDDEDMKKAWFKQAIADYVNGHEFLTIDEVLTAAELTVRLDIQVYIHNEDYDGCYTNSFYSKTINVEPYNEFDFIKFRVRYYQRNDEERRVNVDVDLIPDFYNEYPTYNKYGWLTDTVTECPYVSEPRDEGDYFCDYKMTLLAFDTVPIGYYDKSNSIEMTYPKSPIRAKIKLEFSAGGVIHTYYSRDFIIGDPNIRMAVDSPQDRKSVQKDTPHLYSVLLDNLDDFTFNSLILTVDGVIERLMPDGENVIYCYDYTDASEIPTPTNEKEEKVYYYFPSENEKALHNAGRDKELLDTPSEGTYYRWEKDLYDWETDQYYDKYTEIMLVNFIDAYRPSVEFDDNGDPIELEPATPEEIDALLNQTLSFPFTGRFSSFTFNMRLEFTDGGYAYINDTQTEIFEIVEASESTASISLDCEDKFIMIGGGKDIIITPTVSCAKEDAEFYYSYELNKEGVVEVSQDLDGKLTVHATPGIDANVELTIIVDSPVFKTISKTITIQVHGSNFLFDNAGIALKNEFHKAGTNLDAAIYISGKNQSAFSTGKTYLDSADFQYIKNVDITWKVTNKKGDEIAKKETVTRDNSEKSAREVIFKDNASMTLTNPDSDDYTITAYYQGIEIATLKVQVRYVDMNKFLSVNIWWILLITLSFLALMIFFSTMVKRSKSTVDRIERVYQVYCQCISNDTLTEPELKRIKREIIRCLHHCEDLNIDAFNQYEKSTRYLRKSLMDTKVLMEKYNDLTLEQKGVLYENLNRDLGKALNVAKEIEAAKNMSEQYHSQANRQNFEVVKEDKPKNKKNK